MGTVNLISAYKGAKAYADCNYNKNNSPEPPYPLKSAEIKTLALLCEELQALEVPFSAFDGYYIGYIIKQIGKEFDLLRFSDDMIVNVELKSSLNHLSDSQKTDKILRQMIKNHYYLNAMKKEIYIYTFVEDDGLYRFNKESKSTEKVQMSELADLLTKQIFNEEIIPDKLFLPLNYLISPFTKTEQFISGNYFLTEHQENIKKDILNTLKTEYSFLCLTADAGTGKTLLLYDIAKNYVGSSIIIHCGKLNSGHNKLISAHHWNIQPIKKIPSMKITDTEKDISFDNIDKNIKVIFIDESQRINEDQLRMIITSSSKYKIPIIFSYDPKQYLNKSENKDIYNYLTEHYDINSYGCDMKKYQLTKKIRTNPKIASFISNLLKIGSDQSNCSYENISVEYFDSMNEMKSYIDYLTENKKWKFITYTAIERTDKNINYISELSDTNAHEVIGQEFDKVAFVMDKNFKYNDNNDLTYNTNGFYDLSGMFYQIITRAVSNLKIIVYNDEQLYYKLLYIKSFGKNK